MFSGKDMDLVVTLISILTLVFLLLLAGAPEAAAQGRVVADGFGAGAGLLDAPRTTSLNARAGYVTGGQLEFGLQAGRRWTEGSSRTVNSIEPWAGWFPVRQGEDVPVSIRIGARFRYGRVSSDRLAEERRATRNTYGASGLVFHEIYSSDAFRLLPQAGLQFARMVHHRNGVSIASNRVSYRIGIGLVFQVAGGHPVFVDPYLEIADGRFSGGLRVSLILSG